MVEIAIYLLDCGKKCQLGGDNFYETTTSCHTTGLPALIPYRISPSLPCQTSTRAFPIEIHYFSCCLGIIAEIETIMSDDATPCVSLACLLG